MNVLRASALTELACERHEHKERVFMNARRITNIGILTLLLPLACSGSAGHEDAGGVNRAIINGTEVVRRGT